MRKFGKNKIKLNCGRIVLSAFLWMVGLPAITVFAGDINSEEERLIQSVDITYEYNGKLYQVKGEYLSQLRSYLMRDNVNLSAQEVNEAIPQAMSNVATGVADGYLIEIQQPVHEENKPNDSTDTVKPQPSENTNPSQNEPTGESTEGDDVSKEGTKEDTAAPTKTNDQNTIEQNTQNEQNTGNSQNSGNTQNDEDTQNSGNTQNSNNTQNTGNTQNLENIQNSGNTQNTENTQSVQDAQNTQNKLGIDGTDIIPSEQGDDMSTDNDVIKKTGFSIRAAIITGGAIMLIFIASIAMAYRVSQFAQEDA